MNNTYYKSTDWKLYFYFSLVTTLILYSISCSEIIKNQDKLNIALFIGFSIIMTIVTIFVFYNFYTIKLTSSGFIATGKSGNHEYKWEDITNFGYHQLARSGLYFIITKDDRKYYFLTQRFNFVWHIKGTNRHPGMIQEILKHRPENIFN